MPLEREPLFILRLLSDTLSERETTVQMRFVTDKPLERKHCPFKGQEILAPGRCQGGELSRHSPGVRRGTWESHPRSHRIRTSLATSRCRCSQEAAAEPTGLSLNTNAGQGCSGGDPLRPAEDRVTPTPGKPRDTCLISNWHVIFPQAHCCVLGTLCPHPEQPALQPGRAGLRCPSAMVRKRSPLGGGGSVSKACHTSP